LCKQERICSDSDESKLFTVNKSESSGEVCKEESTVKREGSRVESISRVVSDLSETSCSKDCSEKTDKVIETVRTDSENDNIDNNTEDVLPSCEIKEKKTCDIRLRVRAEYCQHDTALDGNVQSNKVELIERQFEMFLQANTILKSRDLGSIICDIKFSELTYLDAFWRDYINGSLQEALKTVFITESLKQAVGHEAIKLLVSVDEDDYESGRLLLLGNLTD